MATGLTRSTWFESVGDAKMGNADDQPGQSGRCAAVACRLPSLTTTSSPYQRRSEIVAASARFVLSLTAVLTAVAAISTPPPAIATRSSIWSQAVTGICGHALLFEGRHEIGTRAGAVAVARDIRASTARRLRRIRALQVPPPNGRLSGRWLRLERRLAAVYADSYVRIYDAIAAANTPRQRAQLPPVLGSLLHVPDALRDTAANLEQRLDVPDCTGGGAPNAQSSAVNP
jgi:hypothetical protein